MGHRLIVARVVAAGFAVGCVVPTVSNAASETPTYIGMTEQDVGVMDRARPAYDAKGVPLGGFRLFPTVDVLSTYDDNIFRTNTPVSDWFFTVSPAARIQSQWGRHFVELYGGLNNYSYVENTGENLTDWRVGADGRLDISRAAYVTANASYAQQHELWSSPNNLEGFQAAPNRYYQVHTDLVAVYRPNRLSFKLAGSFDKYNWTKTPTFGNGFLNNADRDQNEYQAYTQVSYDFSPGYSGYLKLSYDQRDFAFSSDRAGYHRSSHGYHADGGVNLQISHLLAGEVYVGYLQQFFPQNVLTPLKNVSGFDFGAELNYFATPLLTLHLTGKRTLDDVVLAGASVADNKNIGVSGDYEFRPNVILQARATYTDARYTGIAQSESYPGVGVGVKYLLNRYATFNLNYYYSNRSTNVAASEYTDNTVSAGLSLHI